MSRKRFGIVVAVAVGALMSAAAPPPAAAEDEGAMIKACLEILEQLKAGFPLLAPVRTARFLGKGSEAYARCNGGDAAVAQRGTPWVDWQNYWATGDAQSKSHALLSLVLSKLSIPDIQGLDLGDRNQRGIFGALLDLERQRMELIKFNLFDNSGTFEQYLTGRMADGQTVDGATLKVWKEMRLPADNPAFPQLKVDADGTQTCTGELTRFRTLTGICNDVRNPAMGSTGQLFARNVEFESTFPDLARNVYARNRHGGRISLMQPDPQVISRKLFTRDQTATPNCNQGRGTPDSKGDCAYKPAPFFNVLAAFWIQFMTHDWFSHLENARNDQSHIISPLGCLSERVGDAERPISPERAAQLGCRQNDKMDATLIADDTRPHTFPFNDEDRLTRAYKTFHNNVTAWWDASQIYGYDDLSRRRMRRDPADPAKLQMIAVDGRRQAGDRYGYLPEFRAPCAPDVPADQCDPIQPEWVGQEATAFPDNWSLGLSFFHNLFVREHNIIVDAFRDKQRTEPNADSKLRNPARPEQPIAYAQLSNDELFEIARLIVAAEIAKIHTIEWTTQLLYDEPLYAGMNGNWSGVFRKQPLLSDVTRKLVEVLGSAPTSKEADQLYSAFAAGSGIVRLPGANHFGSPFNFPEEFPSVYRLHPLVPDLLEFRDIKDPNVINKKVPVVDTFRGKATAAMREGGLDNWALTMGRQRLGLLVLRNHPQFLQNLDLRPRMDSTIDVAALDIIRDRERGIPRFNEFRRQIGLKQLSSFDDLIDRHLSEGDPNLADQRDLVKAIREVYGQHKCDASKIITTAQLNPDGSHINDCLGHKDGSTVDNIEDVDIVVGFLAETTRPHGYAISETQFHIFIINASRRLFSDRFFTESFKPAFYTQLGYDWVMNNGPGEKQLEPGEVNGHPKQEVLPLKRLLLRTMPELAPELAHVVNSFDPWGRDRGQYYSLDWTPRADAKADPAFAPH
ncbi:MAG TPA: peroxidase family protein [Xanthobacteraceae bacterium]|nr:peroxidase family protein [Xanthobacteraceae bacterium]